MSPPAAGAESSYDRTLAWAQTNATAAYDLLKNAPEQARNFLKNNVVTFDKDGKPDLAPMWANLTTASQDTQKFFEELKVSLDPDGSKMEVVNDSATRATNFTGRNSGMIGAIMGGVLGIMLGGGGVEGLLIGAVLAMVFAMFAGPVMETIAPGSTATLQAKQEDEKGRGHVRELLQAAGKDPEKELSSDKVAMTAQVTRKGNQTGHVHIIGTQVDDNHVKVEKMINDNVRGEDPLVVELSGNNTFEIKKRSGLGASDAVIFKDEARLTTALDIAISRHELAKDALLTDGHKDKLAPAKRASINHANNKKEEQIKLSVAHLPVKLQPNGSLTAAKGGAFQVDASAENPSLTNAALRQMLKGEHGNEAQKILKDAINNNDKSGNTLPDNASIEAIADRADQFIKALPAKNQQQIARVAKDGYDPTSERALLTSALIPAPTPLALKNASDQRVP